MTDMLASNDKLRDRQLRILAEATGAGLDHCRDSLHAAGGDARLAVVMLIAGAGLESARQALAAADGHVHVALGLLNGHHG